LQAPEEGRLVLFDSFVEDRLVMAEDERRVLLAELGGRAERGEGFSGALLPFPEPDRVEMGVTDEMDPALRDQRLLQAGTAAGRI